VAHGVIRSTICGTKIDPTPLQSVALTDERVRIALTTFHEAGLTEITFRSKQ
jgi:hypothetical protein